MDIKALAVLVLVSTMPVHAADNTSLNPQDAGANMVQAGFDLVIRSLADGIISLWQSPGKAVNANFDNTTFEQVNVNVTEKYGHTRSSIMTFVSINVQPDKIKAVQDVEYKTTPIWLLLVVFYILGNPIRNILARAGYQTYSSSFGTPNLSGEKYIGTVILLCCSYATPNLVLLLIQACTIASGYFMLSIMDYIEPSLGNAWLYLFMAIGEAILAVFFIVRPWVICVVYAVCKLLAVWFLIGVWKGEIIWVWSRFFKILTLQPVVIFVTCICLVGIEWSGMGQVTGAYIVMFALLFYISYKWTAGNFDLPGRLTRLAVRSAL
jgi:hypothetical protein